MAIVGGCRCGAVRYELAMDRLPSPYACHCLHCQTTSGSAFGLHALLPEAAVVVTGPLVTYEHEGTAGLPSRQHVCGDCHTRVYNHNAAIPGMVILRAGTLDDSNLLEPVAHIWVTRKQPWVVIPAGVRSWGEAPTPEEFAAALPKAR
jgi:hypothetical protein